MYLSPSYHTTTRPERLMEIVDKVAALVKGLREKDQTITHLVATGSSGQSVAWPVSYKLGIPVCIVRKPGENSHAGLISGQGDLVRYLIIDDLISTGASIRRTVAALEAQWTEGGGDLRERPECAGVVLYQDSRPASEYPERRVFNVNSGGEPKNVPLYGDNYACN